MPHKWVRFSEMDMVVGLANRNIETNTVTELYMYRKGFCSITLRDAAGNEIPMTAEGKKHQITQKTLRLNYSTRQQVHRLRFLVNGQLT